MSGRFSYLRPSESALRKICTSINQPYLIWAAVNCHVPPPKDQGDWDPQSKKRRRPLGKKRRSRRGPWWGEVAQRWSSAGQLDFNYKILVAVLTNIGLCEFNNRATRYQTWRNSANFRITVTKNFFMKNWKGLGEWIWDIYYRYQR